MPMFDMSFTFEPIGIVRSCFTEKFGIPRQSGLVAHAMARIEFTPPFDDAEAFAGLEGVTHLWLQFVFHQNKRQNWKPRVKAPRLGGNKTAGVFATRSPTRPNPIGLSVVALERVEEVRGRVSLVVSGHDLLDGTPILDVKPYVPYADCIITAKNPFADGKPLRMAVEFNEEALSVLITLGEQKKALIEEVLALDPRPAFHNDLSRQYGTQLEGLEVKWHYREHYGSAVTCVVDSICKIENT